MTGISTDLWPYQSGAMVDGAGQCLRPGGSQLTARAVFCGAWQPGERVIDVGCGRGSTLDYLRRCGFNAVGVDMSESTLQLARELIDDAAVVRASGESLPFADASADGVLAECSLSLMGNAPTALAEFHRVLRDGGRLVVTDVYARHPQALVSDTPLPACISGVLQKDRTICQLKDAGFGLETWEDHSSVLAAFIARFIFEYGSLGALWGGSPANSADKWVETAKRLHPGYALLVARKGNC